MAVTSKKSGDDYKKSINPDDLSQHYGYSLSHFMMARDRLQAYPEWFSQSLSLP